MASLTRRLPSNAPGDVFVDDTCIDCMTCRWLAPAVFDGHEGASRVHRQPVDQAGWDAALRAAVSCPTGSIGVGEGSRLAAAARTFPRPFAPDAWHCGFHARDSFGAASWLLRTPAGNVLIDSPRFADPLVRGLEALGGVRWLFLTHRDDVADHARFAAHFGAERWIHADDAHAAKGAERTFREPVELTPGVRLLPTPGHTRGSACLRWRDAILFSGDTLAWDPEQGHVVAFRDACWYSWPTLTTSVAALRAHRFEWLLPGHGAPVHLPADEMAVSLERCLAWMKA